MSLVHHRSILNKRSVSREDDELTKRALGNDSLVLREDVYQQKADGNKIEATIFSVWPHKKDNETDGLVEKQ